MMWTSYLPSSPESLSLIERWSWIIAACFAIIGIFIGFFARGVGQHRADILQTQLTSTLTEAKDKVLDMEKKQTPRRLSEQQKEIIIQRLKEFKGAKICITAIWGDNESIVYANDISSALQTAGWIISGTSHGIFSPTNPIGLILKIKDNSNPPLGGLDLPELLIELGIQFIALQDTNIPSDKIEMIVGCRQ